MLVLLYGPPGAGKSTIVTLARKKGFSAVDLEEVGHGSDGPRLRKKAAAALVAKDKTAATNSMTLVGTADMHLSDFLGRHCVVLLLPPKNSYLKRLAERDRQQPHKKGQGAAGYWYDAFAKESKKFTHVVAASGTPARVLNQVLSICRAETERGTKT